LNSSIPSYGSEDSMSYRSAKSQKFKPNPAFNAIKIPEDIKERKFK